MTSRFDAFVLSATTALFFTNRNPRPLATSLWHLNDGYVLTLPCVAVGMHHFLRSTTASCYCPTHATASSKPLRTVLRQVLRPRAVSPFLVTRLRSCSSVCLPSNQRHHVLGHRRRLHAPDSTRLNSYDALGCHKRSTHACAGRPSEWAITLLLVAATAVDRSFTSRVEFNCFANKHCVLRNTSREYRDFTSACSQRRPRTFALYILQF